MKRKLNPEYIAKIPKKNSGNRGRRSSAGRPSEVLRIGG